MSNQSIVLVAVARIDGAILDAFEGTPSEAWAYADAHPTVWGWEVRWMPECMAAYWPVGW